MSIPEIEDLKKQFKKLYIKSGGTAKDVGEKIGISQKTASYWVKKYGWKAERERVLKERILAIHPDKTDTHLIIGYWDFMKEKHPRIYKHISESLNEYLQLKA